MKSTQEIFQMLVSELRERIKHVDDKEDYHNKALGDTSFLLAVFLGDLLEDERFEWEETRWMDDCLITKAIKEKETIHLEGIMIWGKDGTTEQWTDPFIFEMRTAEKNGEPKFTFWFCDQYKQELSYEVFWCNRSYWDDNRRNWKYMIDSEVLHF